MAKNIALAAGWMLAIVLGGALYLELNTVRALNEKLDAAQAAAASVKAATARVVSLEEKCAALEEAVARLKAASGSGMEKAAALKEKMPVPEGFDAGALVKNMFGGDAGAAGGDGEDGENKKGNPFAAMFEGEKGEQLMENMLPSQVDMQYGQLFQELKLTPERKAALRDALIAHARKQSAAGMAFMRGEDEVGDVSLPTNDDLMASLEAILTPEELAQVEEYQETMPERMMRQTYDMQLGMMAGDLPEDVRVLTVDVLVENMLAANPEGNMGAPDFESMRAAFDNTLVVLEQELPAEHIDRVRAFLQQQRAGIDMAAQMFGAEEGDEAEVEAP